MLTEMLGKGGTLCSQARSGELRCPLIVRPTSEDIITGHLFQSLAYLNPRWWLPDLLNEALSRPRFRKQVYRHLKISLWQNQPAYPRELLPWDEGSTQVDAVITWENPPTTVFIEAKYGSGLSARVSNDDGESGYPSDQLVRNIRVGLHRAGWFRAEDHLFTLPPRDLVVLVLAPNKGHPLVRRYRDPKQLRAAIPHSDGLTGLPRSPFVGEISYADVMSLLRRQSRWLNRAERLIADDLAAYLDFKLTSIPARSSPRSPGGSDPTAMTTSAPPQALAFST